MDNDNIDEMVSSVLKVLSNPLRIKVVLVLREGEKRVSEIADRTNCHQANLARHLNELKIIDFIESRREGQSKYYFLKSPELLKVIDIGEAFIKDRAKRKLAKFE